MTYKEQLKGKSLSELMEDAKYFGSDGYYHDLSKPLWEEINRRVNSIEKYKWHDLRKNPNDLPKYDEMVIVALQYADGDVLTTAMGYRGYSATFGGYRPVGCYGYGVTEVIAWREIEPFEVEE